VRDALVRHDGLPPERFEVLPKGVDLAAIDAVPAADLRAALGLPQSATLLCSVGRLIPDKGHAYLLRALARLPEAVRDVHLVLVGGGPEEERLRAAATAAGLGARVHLLGVRADAIALMKAADVFVLPSLEEGLPVVLLEAMSCALPIVAADVGSVKSLIRRGETGMLVPPAERWANGVATGADERTQEAGVAALAEALAALLADRSRGRALGAAARTFIERFRTVESSIARLEQLYAECLAGTAPVPVAAGARAG
jgi:glycosyltransferase involved in cell wall biosynthesis